MTRRCSQCSNNGHNSRTCPGKTGGVRLFGVRLTEGVRRTMKKSASMGCLSSAVTAAAVASGSPDPPQEPADAHASGYASDDPRASSSSNSRADRKKGIPWTEEEHQMFLLGLQKLGKGDWRGISRNFVISRTPTQVASHAQKYFIRQSNASRKKRRSSLFDMVPQPKNHLPLLKEHQMPQCPPSELECTNQLPSFKLCQDQGSEPAESSSRNSPEMRNHEMRNHPSYACGPAYNSNSMPVVSEFYPALFPVQFAYWPAAVTAPVEEVVAETHEVLKPTPVLPKDPANAAAIAGMSKLSIVEGAGILDPASLSLKLMEDSSLGQSAFHMNPTIAASGLSQSSSNAIHAV